MTSRGLAGPSGGSGRDSQAGCRGRGCGGAGSGAGFHGSLGHQGRVWGVDAAVMRSSVRPVRYRAFQLGLVEARREALTASRRCPWSVLPGPGEAPGAEAAARADVGALPLSLHCRGVRCVSAPQGKRTVVAQGQGAPNSRGSLTSSLGLDGDVTNVVPSGGQSCRSTWPFRVPSLQALSHGLGSSERCGIPFRTRRRGS